jgi:hypothetical protein
MSDIGRKEGEGERFKGEMYRFILRKAGHRFDHLFAVGNLYSDLAPAKRLGLIPIGMKGSYYLQPEVRRGFPVAKDFATLPRLVARLARS